MNSWKIRLIIIGIKMAKIQDHVKGKGKIMQMLIIMGKFRKLWIKYG